MRPTSQASAILMAIAAGTAAVFVLSGRPSPHPPPPPPPRPPPTPVALLRGAWDTLPGLLSVGEAIQTPDGWLLMDGRAARIHLLSDDGRLLSSWGRTGDGPGDLRYPAGMAVRGDTIWVADIAGTRIDAFTATGEFLLRIRPDMPCTPPFLDDLVASGKELVLAVRCFGADGAARHLVGIDLPSGRTRPIAWPGPERSALPGDMTRLVSTPNGLLAGSVAQPCLHSATHKGSVGPCLDPARRVVLPKAVHDSLRARRSRQRLPGLSDQVSTYYPYLTDVSYTEAGVVLVRPTGERTAAVHGLGRQGRWEADAPEGSVPFVGRDEILLVEEVLEGIRIATAALPGSGL